MPIRGPAEICDEFYPAGVARLGWTIRYFRRRGITQATMAGKIFKAQGAVWQMGLALPIPDLTPFVPTFPCLSRGERTAMMMRCFGTVVDEYARCGITLAPATDFAPELLVKQHLTRRQPTAAERKDIEFGWQIAKELGRLDVGQSVVVKGRSVIAVEAVEGTDECIRRAGQLCPQGGFTVVKVAKPQQDMRFDVPTIGILTVQNIVAAGGKVLAIEAGKTIVVDQAEVVRLADEHGLTIVAMDGDAVV